VPPSAQQLPVRDTEHIIDALNRAIEMDVSPEERTEFLLEELLVLLHRKGRAQLLLLEELERIPAPLVVRRHVRRAPDDTAPIAPNAEFQQAFDKAVPLLGPAVQAMLKETRTPKTVIGSLDVGSQPWFVDHMMAKYLRPVGFEDVMLSMWAASPNRAVAILLLRPGSDPPFTESDRMLMSLMLRAIAPLVDREIFHHESLPIEEPLTPRQQEVLMMLLTGDSKKQIARLISRSEHTVHTYIRQIYKSLGVSSRGELMSRFVDRKLKRMVEGAMPAVTA
jgi:DNA-binding CsgD family transcriptional regulator